MREPTLTDQYESLYNFLSTTAANPRFQQLHISRSRRPHDRTYEGGVEQSFFSQHILFPASYFHNEFGKQIEYVGLDLVPELLPI